MADADDGPDDPIFRPKVQDIIWGPIVEDKESNLISRLFEADKKGPPDVLKTLVDEVESKFEILSSCRIKTDDVDAVVENLVYLFEMSQCVMEIKDFRLVEAQAAVQAGKEKLKQQKVAAKEMTDRISEQDDEIEQLTNKLKATLSTAPKGRGQNTEGDVDPAVVRRKDLEIKNLQQERDLMKDEIITLKRDLIDQKEAVSETQRKLNEQNQQIIMLNSELTALSRHNEELTQSIEAEAQKQRLARQQNQKTSKEALKFVQEVRELSLKVEELENERDQTKLEIEGMTDEILELRDDLKDVGAKLESTEKLRAELEVENMQLRDKVAELIVSEERNTEEHDNFMQDITRRVRLLKEENAKFKSDLEARDHELSEAKASIARLEQEKRQSEVERRFLEVQSELDVMREERAADLDKIVLIQRENAGLRGQIRKLEEEMKKQQKRLQAQYKEKENDVRAFFHERQEEMFKTERTNLELQKRLAELEDENIQHEQTISQLENGTFGLTEAMAKVKEIKRELEVISNRMSERTKGFNDALRKIEDLHEEVRMLRDHLVKVDPELKRTAAMIGFQPVYNEDHGSELDWVGFKDGFKLDITAYKVRTAMELEKAKAMNLQLEREVEALETERLEMKSQLRLLSLQKGERAAKLGLTAADIEKLDAFAEHLKSGDPLPLDFPQSAAENNQNRKLNQRLIKLDKDLKDREQELTNALETVVRLKEEMKTTAGMQETLEEMRNLAASLFGYQSQGQLYFQQGSEGQDPQVHPGEPSQGTENPQVTPARPAGMRFGLGMATPVRLGMAEGYPGGMFPFAGPQGPGAFGAGQQTTAALTPQLFDQLAKALREGELADQANVDFSFKGIRNVPSVQMPRIYAVASINRATVSSKTYPLPPPASGSTMQFAKDESHRLAVGNRNTDHITVSVYEALESDKQDRSKDRLIGQNQISIESWAKGTDKLWSGSTETWLVLLDSFGKPLLGSSKQRTEIQIHLKFLESASKRAQVLEEQLEAVKEVSKFTSQRLESCENDLARLREDLSRKTEDLELAVEERNKLRVELQRTRLNSGFDMTRQVKYSSRPDGKQGEDDSGALDQSELLTQMADLNAHLIEALDALTKREEEAVSQEAELKRYSEDMEVLRVQQVLLYKEHVERVGEMEKELKKCKRELSDAVQRGDMEAKKSSVAMEKLSELSRSSTADQLRHIAIEAERKSMVLEAERDELQRGGDLFRQELTELRDRYDSLVLDMARQQHRLKQRIGRLDRAKNAAERRLAQKYRQLEHSVSQEEYDRLRREHLILKEKHAVVVNEGSKALLEQAAVQGHHQRVQKLTHEKEELELKLSEASDRASALASRLEMLALKDGPPDQNMLVSMSEKLVKLEVSERNFGRRYDLCLERLRGAEQERVKFEERISVLEAETMDKAVAMQRLQENDRELRSKLERTISAEEAAKLRAQVARQEEEIAELKSTSQKYEEMAELATDQAKAMEELQTVHKNELDALRAFLSQVQAESENAAELGILHRKVIDRDRQIHELDAKITNLDRELVRLDAYVVRLEEGLERKNEELYKFSEQSLTETKRLESTINDLSIRAAGQIPLEKVDEWASSLRDLTEQKKTAEDELASVRKARAETEEHAEKLQIQLEEQRRLAGQLREEIIAQTKQDLGDNALRSVTSAERLAAQAEELTKLKVESLRLSRQVKQLQEREAHLDRACQQAEKDLRISEEALVQARAELETRSHQSNDDLLNQVSQLQRKIKDLEQSSSNVRPPGNGLSRGGPTNDDRLQLAPSRRVPTAISMPPAESKAADYEAMSALNDQIMRLTDLLRDKEEKIEQLESEVAKLMESAARTGPNGDGDSGDGAKLAVAAEHTQEVARLTIERLEKNNERKSALIQKYQEQLRAARSEYMEQKELDAATIEDLRQKLAAKSNESIHQMRNRVQGSQAPLSLSGPAADTDAIFAEKNKLIKGLSDDLQQTKERLEAQIHELQSEVKAANQKVEEKEQELEHLRNELQKKSEEKPSQKLEALVSKLRKQLSDKESKQQEMKAAIQQLKDEMIKAAEMQSRSQSSVSGVQDGDLVKQLSETLKLDMEKLKTKLDRMKGEQAKMKKELDTEREAKELAKKDLEEERAAKGRVESELLRVNKDLKKALKEKKDSQDALKALEEGAMMDKKRIDEVERQVKEADKATPKGMKRPTSPLDAKGDSDKDKAMRRWEAEKRLESKVEDLREKLREQRKEIDAMEKQHIADIDKANREAEKLRQQIEKLEQDKRTLKEELRGGAGVDSEELLKRVREAERSVFELQEQNDKLKQAQEVDQKEKENEYKERRAALERQVKELREDKESLTQQMQRLSAEDIAGFDREKAREVRRLESEVTRLREREDELEKELLSSQNQVLRLRFEDEHAALKLQRWRRRVRELESLPLAVGRAVAAEGLKLKGGKDDEEMERFVRSTKVAMEKLHKENEALKANSASNVKYMEVVKENKQYKASLAERDKEILALNDKLGRLKEQADKKSKAEERCYSLERQLREEAENADKLNERLRDRERQVTRLEADLRAVREVGSAGGGGGGGEYGQLAAETEALEGRLKASERQRVELETELSTLRRDLSAARKRVTDLEAQILARPAAPGTQPTGANDAAEARRLRDEVRKLQQENEELKAELDSFDPAFFDEIEDLKYQHNEMTRLVERYETLLVQLSTRYGFDYTPPAPAPRPARPARP